MSPIAKVYISVAAAAFLQGYQRDVGSNLHRNPWQVDLRMLHGTGRDGSDASWEEA